MFGKGGGLVIAMEFADYGLGRLPNALFRVHFPTISRKPAVYQRRSGFHPSDACGTQFLTRLVFPG